MYLAVVPLHPCRLEGVRIPLSLPQISGVERACLVRRDGVRSAVPVDLSDPRPSLDGDVGRLEAEVLDHDRPRGMLARRGRGLGRGLFVRPVAETTNGVLTRTSTATVANKTMRLISVTSSSYFSRPTAEIRTISVVQAGNATPNDRFCCYFYYCKMPASCVVDVFARVRGRSLQHRSGDLHPVGHRRVDADARRIDRSFRALGGRFVIEDAVDRRAASAHRSP
jgi:hypothetical protein